MIEAKRLSPTDRAEWLEMRRHDVTASQIAALVNAHPYCTKFELWAAKSGKLEPENTENEAMRRGRLLEPIAAKLAIEAIPEVTEAAYNSTNQYWRSAEHRIGATPDIIAESPRGRGVIQLKSVEPSLYDRTWRDQDPPLWIALQALTEAHLVGAQWAMVGVLRVGHGVEFDLTEIPLHAGAWSRLLEEAARFWQSVEADTPPAPDYARDAAVIAELYPASAGASIDLSGDNELMDALQTRELAKERASG